MMASISGDAEELINQRAIKELVNSELESEALVLITYPQYKLEEVRDMANGDFELLERQARKYQAQRDLMALSIAIASKDKKSSKLVFNELKKIANKA